MSPVSLSDTTHGQPWRAVTLENHTICASLLYDQGADIYSLIHKPSGIDVIWKVSLPRHRPGLDPALASASEASWHAAYRGGWQTIFPNFGPENEHNGARLPFHGEAARLPWQVEAVEDGPHAAAVRLGVTLRHSPFRLQREVRLPAGGAALFIRETVTNLGPEARACMWVQHPTFGPPFLSPKCVIDTGARTIWADDGYEVPGNDLPPGETWAWPHARNRQGQPVDLSRVPAPGSGHSRVLFLKDFAASWYALTNPALGLGVGVAWDGALFPYATFWQETGGVQDFPFYGGAYVTALEPASSYPGHGLSAVVKKTGTHLTFAPGESRTLALTAVLYEGGQRVQGVDLHGNVTRSVDG
jgi:hypothetical protein